MAEETGFTDPAPEPAAPVLDNASAAAILFLLVGEAQALQLMDGLDPAEVRQLARAVYAVDNADTASINAALAMFVERAAEQSGFGALAQARLESVLDQSLGDQVAQGLLAPIAPPRAQPRFVRLPFLTADIISQLVAGEHPQLIALVCAHIEADVAAAVVAAQPEEEQDDILYRMAQLEPVGPNVLEEVEEMLLSKPAQGSGRVSRRGGVGDVAAVLNAMARDQNRRALKALSRRDRELARRVEEEMLTFADLLALDDRGLGTLLRAVDNALLVPALKGATDRMRARCLGCMSARAAQSIEDELIERGPMPLAAVEAAQRAIVAVARRLGDEGVLMLGGAQADYV